MSSEPAAVRCYPSLPGRVRDLLLLTVAVILQVSFWSAPPPRNRLLEVLIMGYTLLAVLIAMAQFTAMVVADPQGLRWRSLLGKWCSVRWEEISNYREIAGRTNPGLHIETPAGTVEVYATWSRYAAFREMFTKFAPPKSDPIPPKRPRLRRRKPAT